MISLVLLIVSAVLLGLAMFGVSGGRVNFLAAGLWCYVLAVLAGRF